MCVHVCVCVCLCVFVCVCVCVFVFITFYLFFFYIDLVFAQAMMPFVSVDGPWCPHWQVPVYVSVCSCV